MDQPRARRHLAIERKDARREDGRLGESADGIEDLDDGLVAGFGQGEQTDPAFQNHEEAVGPIALAEQQLDLGIGGGMGTVQQQRQVAGAKPGQHGRLGDDGEIG